MGMNGKCDDINQGVCFVLRKFQAKESNSNYKGIMSNTNS